MSTLDTGAPAAQEIILGGSPEILDSPKLTLWDRMRRNNTLRFVLRRAAFYLFTAWAAITLNFVLPRLMPGDAIETMVLNNPQLSPEAIESLSILFGLDRNLTLGQEYLQYWQMIFRGEFGISFSHGLAPVTQVIAAGVPWTLGLVGLASVMTFILGITIGSIIGWKRGTRAEALIPFGVFIGTIPFFWLALVFIAVFSVRLGWFPVSHAYGVGTVREFSWPFIREVIHHGALPALTIVASSVGGSVLGMRNMMMTVLDEDYITVAQAKGLRDRKVLRSYALRNAILPQIQSFTMGLGFVVGGSLVLEMVFSYPGIGLLMMNATNARDFPLMQGIFLLVIFSVLIANLLADVVLAILDPRSRQMES